MGRVHSRRSVCCILLNAAAIFLVLAAAPAAAQKPKPLSKGSVAAVDEAVDAEMQRQQLVGVAVGMIRHGAVALTTGDGFAEAETQIPATKRTVFNWASNCKPLTAVAAMQLVQKGKLDLDL